MKKAIIIILAIFIIITGFLFFAESINEDSLDSYDKKPLISRPNVITLYNDGCCFVFEDFSLFVETADGKQYPLFTHEAPEYKKIYQIPVDLNVVISPVTVHISFYFENSGKGNVSFPIMEFQTIEQLKKNGLLLCFGDGDLRVISKSEMVFFQQNVDPWIVQDIPEIEEQPAEGATPINTNDLKVENPIELVIDRVTFISVFMDNEDDRPDGQVPFAEARALLFPMTLPDSLNLTVYEVTNAEIWEKTGVQIYDIIGEGGMHSGAIIKDGQLLKEFADGLGSTGFYILELADYNSDGVCDFVYSYTHGSGMIRTDTSWLDLKTGEIHLIESNLFD